MNAKKATKKIGVIMDGVRRQSIIKKHRLLVVIFVIVVMAIGVKDGSLYCFNASRRRSHDVEKRAQDSEINGIKAAMKVIRAKTPLKTRTTMRFHLKKMIVWTRRNRSENDSEEDAAKARLVGNGSSP